MKWWVKAGFLLGLMMAAGFLFALTALADDCSGLVDCYGVGAAAAAAGTQPSQSAGLPEPALPCNGGQREKRVFGR